MQEQHRDPLAAGQVRNQPRVRSIAHLLIAIGVLELIYGQWAAPPGQIKLDFGLLAVGLGLYFGGAKMVAAIRWLALFAVVPAVVLPVQQALLGPVELTLVQLHLYPAQVIVSFVPMVVNAVVVLVVALRLNSEPVKAILREHRTVVSGPVVPVVLGALLIIGTTAFLRNTLDGPEAARAVELAANRFGTRYKYFTNRINIVNNNGITVYATVQMWNNKEALQVPVQWRQ